MKLQETTVSIKKSEGFTPQESFFKIGDESVIFGILREKLYSNAIRTICQEIMSNGRDAHREIGKVDADGNELPIIVTLPNSFEPFFKVQDFGPGISPDRMENIFIAFGSSTKRNDNVQTGGFGLGAKSPFAYSDTFSVITNTPENDKMIKRSYTAYIDETQKGKMALVNEMETNETLSGTTIIIPVKPEDHQDFRNWTIECSKYWLIRPIINGIPNFSWPEVKRNAEGHGWYMIETGEQGNYKSAIILTIDGIPYELQWESVKSAIHKNLDNAQAKQLEAIWEFGYYSNERIMLDFNVGELALIANREEVDYGSYSTNKIIERLLVVSDELTDSIQKYIAGLPSFKDAIIYCKGMASKLKDIIGEIKWNDKVVKDTYVIKYPSRANITVYQRRISNVKCTNENGKVIEFGDNSILAFNDLSDTSERRRVLGLFENRNINIVRVIDLPDDEEYIAAEKRRVVTEAENLAANPNYVKDDTIHPQSRAEDIELLDKTIYFNDLELVNLSTVPKKAIIRTSGGNSGSSMPVAYTFVSGRSDREIWESIWDGIDFENGIGVYAPVESRNAIDAKGEISLHMIKAFYRNNDEKEIYGIPKRNINKLGSGWVHIRDACRQMLLKMVELLDKETVVFADMKEAIEYSFSNQLGHIYHKFNSSSLIDQIEDKDGVFMRYYMLENELKTYQVNYYDRVTSFMNACTWDIKDGIDISLNNGGIKMKDVYKEFFNMYPMATIVESYSYRRDDRDKIIKDYINLIDKMKKEEESVLLAV